jgi:hypothetical protein
MQRFIPLPSLRSLQLQNDVIIDFQEVVDRAGGEGGGHAVDSGIALGRGGVGYDVLHGGFEVVNEGL